MLYDLDNDWRLNQFPAHNLILWSSNQAVEVVSIQFFNLQKDGSISKNEMIKVIDSVFSLVQDSGKLVLWLKGWFAYFRVLSSRNERNVNGWTSRKYLQTDGWGTPTIVSVLQQFIELIWNPELSVDFQDQSGELSKEEFINGARKDTSVIAALSLYSRTRCCAHTNEAYTSC